ncbi:MAG TPA: hypothetical protein VIL28_03685, partial [Steroidobacteraceae bacterium]
SSWLMPLSYVSEETGEAQSSAFSLQFIRRDPLTGTLRSALPLPMGEAFLARSCALLPSAFSLQSSVQPSPIPLLFLIAVQQALVDES